jgi:Fur family zinc uptake transcriptional regulator
MSHSHDQDQGCDTRDHAGHHHPPIPLTPARQRILDVLCAAKAPLGAYDMIDRLAEATGKRLAPVSVYRALEFLVDNGFVHRLSSRNAYLACWHGHRAREPVAFLICDACGSVSEATSQSMMECLAGLAEASGFATRTQVIELTGTCAMCRGAASA